MQLNFSTIFPSPRQRGRLVFLLLVLFVAVNNLNYDSFPDIIASRSFGQLTERALLRTAFDFAIFGGLAIIGGTVAFLSCPALRKPHRAFLTCICVLGPIYLFLFTPFSVPDETHHYRQSLVRAACLAGEDKLDESYLLSANSSHKNTCSGYVNARKAFKRTEPVGRDFLISKEALAGNALQHIPQTIGLWLGLKMKLAPLANFYLGRLFALVFYALVAALAVKTAPVLKECIAIVSLCPMAMQQACSYSYDCEAFSIAFLCLALFLRLCVERPEKPCKWTMAAACAVTLLGIAVKCCTLPFMPFLFAIPPSRFMWGKRGKAAFLASLFVLSAGIASVAIFSLGFGQLSGGGSAWTFRALFGHPLRLAHIMINTFDRYVLHMALDAFGRSLSGFTIQLPFLYAVFLLLACVQATRLERSSLTQPIRMAAIAGVLLQTAFAILPMLTTFTPMGRMICDGLQGRYWTTVIPLVACATLASRSTEARPSSDSATYLFPNLLILHLAVMVFVVKITMLTY